MPKRIRLIVPEEFEATHVPAVHISGDWYLVPRRLLTSTVSYEEFTCYPYDPSGEVDLENPRRFTSAYFEF